jgi:hypothetical protein
MASAVSKPIPFREVPVINTIKIFSVIASSMCQEIPLLPLISSAKAVATSSAVVAKENVGEDDML